MNTNENFPRIISDINGIDAKLCLETKPYTYQEFQVFNCKDYSSLSMLIESYLSKLKMLNKVKSLVIITPDTIYEGVLSILNISWLKFSINETKETLFKIGINNLVFVNSNHATSLSIPLIPKSELIPFEPLKPENSSRPKITLRPSDKLEIATIVCHPKTREYLTVYSEGSHCSFGPTSEIEQAIYEYAKTRHDYISSEIFISNSGIILIYEALCHINHTVFDKTISTDTIIQNALNNQDLLSKKSIDIFCEMFGSFTGNLASMTNAFGGIYLGGNIITKMVDYFIKSNFHEKFQAKGRYRIFLEKIPIFIINSQNAILLGASYALDTYIKDRYIP